MTLVSNSLRRKKLKQAKKKALAGPPLSAEEQRALLITGPMDPMPPIFTQFKEGDICSLFNQVGWKPGSSYGARFPYTSLEMRVVEGTDSSDNTMTLLDNGVYQLNKYVWRDDHQDKIELASTLSVNPVIVLLTTPEYIRVRLGYTEIVPAIYVKILSNSKIFHLRFFLKSDYRYISYMKAFSENPNHLSRTTNKILSGFLSEILFDPF